ncbi:hypothetical protein J8273_2437 [Carpediemonas membranifera]|uniref:Uncharacterized protein n=1 Tax=Carpediemonas membranifera TaxID=201153 RepID=A0A8J6EB29_9EUKA|nr:hypothetical protein J8273_2437 [Carpediemonas membranifera]|eukprot:KAG9396085.1 hypothetical protein J8273_2437 [Carpediemonas membranifera]
MKTASIHGDIPSLLRHAYSRHFQTIILPSHSSKAVEKCDNSNLIDKSTRDELLALLAKMPPLEPAAQELIDRACSILTDGPRLSMNIKLAEEHESPVALHTLLHPTIWTILLHADADQDLEPALGSSKGEAATDKCLWFLCKKFFFALQTAEKNGTASSTASLTRDTRDTRLYRTYAGRVLTAQADDPRFRLVRMPRVVELHTHPDTQSFIAVTPHGLYAQGTSRGHLGISEGVAICHDRVVGFVPDPTRISFRQCRRLAVYEANLPPWKKHHLVKQLSVGNNTLLLSPVGVALSSCFPEKYIPGFESDMASRFLFHQIPLPVGFAPDFVNAKCNPVISMGRQRMTCLDPDQGFVEAIPVDHVFNEASTGNACFFLSGRGIYLAGVPPQPPDRTRRTWCNIPTDDQLMLYGLVDHPWVLPALTHTTQRLRFKSHVKAFYGDWDDFYG